MREGDDKGMFCEVKRFVSCRKGGRKLHGVKRAHCNENPIYVFLFWELIGLGPNSHIYIFPEPVHIFPAAELAERSWEYINRSQTHECGYWVCGRAIPLSGNICFEFSELVLCSAE